MQVQQVVVPLQCAHLAESSHAVQMPLPMQNSHVPPPPMAFFGVAVSVPVEEQPNASARRKASPTNFFTAVSLSGALHRIVAPALKQADAILAAPAVAGNLGARTGIECGSVLLRCAGSSAPTRMG